jgi:hypothetical protein
MSKVFTLHELFSQKKRAHTRRRLFEIMCEWESEKTQKIFIFIIMHQFQAQKKDKKIVEVRRLPHKS